MKKYTLLSLLITLFSFTTLGQTVRERKTIDVDLNAEGFVQALPFDEYFNIKGDYPVGTTHIRLSYKPKSPLRNYYKDDIFDNIRVHHWDNSTNPKNFLFSMVGPLKPNTKYNFIFETLEKLVITDICKQKITDEIVEILQKEFPDGDVSNGNRIKAKAEVNKVLFAGLQTCASIARIDLRDKNNQPLEIDPFDGNLITITNKILESNIEINKAKNDFDVSKSYVESYFNRISDILKLTDLDMNSKETIKKHKTKIESLALKFRDGDSKDSFFSNISDKEINELGFLSELDSIKKSNGTHYFLEKEIIKIYAEIKKIAGYNQTIIDNSKIKNVNITVLSDLYINQVFTFDDMSEIEVNTKDTPYISLDMGIATPLSGSLPFLTYQGANISLCPVNKKTPLSYFKLGGWLSKAFSFNIGVGQSLGEQNDSDYKGSLGRNSYLILGAGLRLNRVTKVSFNFICFRKDMDKNPVVDDFKWILKPYPSISFDINLLKAIDGLLPKLGL